MNAHLILIIAYCLVLILMGLWIGRRVKSSGSFFVAERRLGAGLLFSTLLAANIGAGSTVGAAGLGFRDGLAAWWWVGSAGVGSILLGLWAGPRIWRIAKKHNLQTAGDFLEHRYGPAVRGVISSLLWVGTLAILAGQLIALAWVLNVVAGIPKIAGCLIGGLVMTVYFTAGGLLGSAWINMLQLAVLLLGFGAALPLILSAAGGWQGLQASLPAENLSFWHNGSSGWPYLILLAPAFIISPGLLQKIYGARDQGTVRRAVCLQGVALLIFALIPPLLGMAARVLYPDLEMREMALPTVLMNELPLWLGGLGLAAIVSAEISSADAILFMLATSLSKDLYQRFVNPDADDAQILKVARLAAVAGGVLGVGLAMLAESVVEVLRIFYGLLTVSLFVPVIAGLLQRRGGVAEALAAIAAGLLTTLSLHLALDELGSLSVWPVAAGLGAAVVLFLVVLWARALLKRPPDHTN